jgi:hypothetical protein
MSDQILRVSDQILRARLSSVALALRPVHKALLDEVKEDYEREHGLIGGPSALLQLASTHPFFAWIRPLLQLMVELDELIDSPPPLVHAEVASIRARLEALLSESSGEELGSRYVIFLQRSTELVIAHAALRRELALL